MAPAILWSLSLHSFCERRYSLAACLLAAGSYVAWYDLRTESAYFVLLAALIALPIQAIARRYGTLNTTRVVALALAASLLADTAGASGVIDAARSAARGFAQGWNEAQSQPRCFSPPAAATAQTTPRPR